MDSIDWIVSCLQNAARLCGCEIPETQAAKDIIGLSIDRAINTLFPDADAPTRTQLVRHYGELFAERPLSRDDLFTGVYGMLTELEQNGYRLAVATGKGRAGLRRVLQETGTQDLFCATRCADETASKPSPLMLHEILAATDVPAQRALMVGDSVHDLQMAAHAGIASVGVSCGAHDAKVLQQYQPLFCLPQTAQLINLL